MTKYKFKFRHKSVKVVLRREYYDGLYRLITAFVAEIVAGLPFLLVMPFLFGTFLNNIYL